MTFQLRDKNGKEFNMTLAQLTDMTTDLPEESFGSLNDSDQSNYTPYDVQILDANGSPLDVISLMDSIKSDSSKLPSAIDVTFEATHSGRNANYFQYDSADLERDAHTWMTPYAKPLIKNHDIHQEPLGRVVDYSFGASEMTDADCINVTYRVTDADAIQKFLDRRYHTMSIGAKTSNVRCNICGKDIIKDGNVKFCGHMRGETYAGQKSYWTAKDFEFKEGSIVNNPADKWAQVKKIQVVKSTASVKDAEENSVEANEKTEAIKDAVANDVSIIDNIIENEEIVEENVQDESQEQVIVEDSEETQCEPEAVELTDAEQLANVKSLLDSVTAERDELTAQITDYEQKVQSLMDERAELEGRIEDAETASKELRQQNARLAVLNKTLLVDRAMDFEQRATKLTDEELENRRGELTQMKATELADLIQSHLEKPVVTIRPLAASVENPGLSDNTDESNVQDEEMEAPAKPVVAKTLKDLENVAVNLFTRNY